MDADERPCPDTEMARLVASMSAGEAGTRNLLDTLLREHPGDARLHFLLGSLLAGQRDYPSAIVAMRRAVEIAPGFDIARFQLGLLLLTSGEPASAETVWAPLLTLSEDHPLRCFVRGLHCLIHDAFEDALTWLEEGMARNSLNPPLNDDMTMVAGEIRTRMRGGAAGSALSATHMLLQQAALKSTKH